MGSWLWIARVAARNSRLIVGRPNVRPALGMEVVLKPSVQLVSQGSGVIIDVEVGDTEGTLNDYVCRDGLLVGDWLTTNVINVKKDADIFSGTAPVPHAMNSGNPMGTAVRWFFNPVTFGAVHWLWNGEDTVRTLTYEDVNGRQARCCWCARWQFGTPNFVAFFRPHIDVEVVSEDRYTVVVRVTRSQFFDFTFGTSYPPDPEAYVYAGKAEYVWTGVGLDGVADPDNPVDTDVVLVSLARGVHKVGVQCVYRKTSTGLLYNFAGEFEVVLEIV